LPQKYFPIQIASDSSSEQSIPYQILTLACAYFFLGSLCESPSLTPQYERHSLEYTNSLSIQASNNVSNITPYRLAKV